MSIRAILLAAVLAVSGAPVLAQSGPMNHPSEAHEQSNNRQDTARDEHRPTARQLNTSNGRYYRMRSRARAQDRMDRRAYAAAITARHHRAVNRYDRRYIRQQTAYAKAMAAWRRQVAACKHGSRRACKAPSPHVANFY
ncbi:MAG: hypothetical protein EOO77_00460 [Oxalobacteraceae bacterium]|nr:MAG: hypothetical protein EOO77_00460 [Oxalobacteraceae bacterium]